MRKVGFICGTSKSAETWKKLHENLLNTEDWSFQKISDFTGSNTGNITHRFAACNLFKEGIDFIHYGMNWAEVSSRCKLLIMPVANLLDGNDQSWLYHLLKFTSGVGVPCILMGVGAQSSMQNEIPQIPPDLIKFFDEFTKAGNHVTVRGEFTAKVLEHYGVTTNIHITGCQSLFLNGHDKLGELIAHKIEKLPNDLIYFSQFLSEPSLNDVFNKLSVESEYVLINGCDSLMASVKNGKLSNIKGINYPPDILSKSKIFVSPQEQCKFLKDSGSYYVVTPRIHGVMISIMAELPVICVVHDSRVRELCETHKIPYCDIKSVCDNSSESLFNLNQFGSDFDENRKKLANVYLDIFKTVGVTPSAKLFG